ncbi:MAG TPA: hypothetical protein VGM03_22495 [Phycisphaerae bacterium]|jgi:Tfp pilus assembly protein PilN
MFSTASFPRCGHCGYNLTAAQSNRCPECGLLFIEAGVIVPDRVRERSKLKVWMIALFIMLLGPAMIGGAMTLHYRAQAAAAQARAAAARAAAQAQVAQAQATAQFLQQTLSTPARRSSVP